MLREIYPGELETAKELYAVNGVVAIRGLFSKASIDRLRALALQAYRRHPEKQLQYRGESPALMFQPSGLDEYTRALAPIVREFIGGDVLQLNKQYYFRLPGDGDEFSWHQDVCFRVPKDKFTQIETGYLQTAIIVDRMDKENGAIEYVMGSHLQGELPDLVPRDGKETNLRKFDRNRFYGEKMRADPGDLLLWSVMIVHGSERNESSRWRSYFMNGFAKRECVHPGLGFPAYMLGGSIV